SPTQQLSYISAPHLIPCHSLSLHIITYHYILIAPHFISFHIITFHYTPFHYIAIITAFVCLTHSLLSPKVTLLFSSFNCIACHKLCAFAHHQASTYPFLAPGN
ncbi:hypothetical protein M758_N020600, partial [Ceratodon purpureus]